MPDQISTELSVKAYQSMAALSTHAYNKSEENSMYKRMLNEMSDIIRKDDISDFSKISLLDELISQALNASDKTESHIS